MSDLPAPLDGLYQSYLALTDDLRNQRIDRDTAMQRLQNLAIFDTAQTRWSLDQKGNFYRQTGPNVEPVLADPSDFGRPQTAVSTAPPLQTPPSSAPPVRPPVDDDLLDAPRPLHQSTAPLPPPPSTAPPAPVREHASKNNPVSELFSNTRGRIIVVVVILVLLLAAYMGFKGSSTPEVTPTTSLTPTTALVVPTTAPTPTPPPTTAVPAPDPVVEAPAPSEAPS